MKLSIRTILFLGLFLLPFYGWDSGSLQISHILLLLFCGFYFSRNGMKVANIDLLLVAILFVVLTRESFAVFSGTPPGALVPALHILYCAIIFNTLRRAFEQSHFDSTLVFSVCGAAIIAVSGVLLIGYSSVFNSYGERAVGTFNNPNQLGYFSVCLFSLASLLRLMARIPASTYVLLVGSALFLSAASLSKAAMISLGVVSLFAAFALIKSRRVLLLTLFGAAAAGVTAYWLYSSGLLSEYAFVARLEGIGAQSDDSFEARGYIPWYEDGAIDLTFGLGYFGALSRIYGGHEVHSTIASFFVQYGLLGGLLFLLFVGAWIAAAKKSFGLTGVILVCVPALIYGLAHNGSRFTVFWVLLALTFAARARRVKEQAIQFQSR